jgi:hypothetical protein
MNNNEIENLAEKALANVVADITLQVFLEIEKNFEDEYQLIKQHNQNINSKIGEFVKNKLQLTNVKPQKTDACSLITSYTKHGL